MDLTTIFALRNRRLIKCVTTRKEAMRGSDSTGGGQ
jgi:hypothetical protein